jgi:hypothetical protein
MKKEVYIILLLLFSIPFFGQNSKKDQGIVFGMKGGLNISNFIGDIEDNKFRTSIHLGIISEIIISDKVSLQPEILYSGQGYSGKTTPGFSRSKYDYLNLPILAKIYLSEKISIETGPQIGFLISAKEKTETDKITIENQNNIDFGLNIGLAYELNSGVFFQTRYNLGLSNVNQSNSSDALRYSNSVIQFSTGIIF